MSAPGFAKQCGVCHVGGGQMEYDRDMKEYGDVTSTDVGGKYTYRVPTAAGAAGAIVPTSTAGQGELLGANKVEVDCMMCHMEKVNNGSAWYKTMGCDGVTMPGPADNLNCNGYYDLPLQPGFDNTDNPDPRFNITPGEIYDSFNRNIATSLGYFQQAATAGIGATMSLMTGTFSNVPATIPGTVIAYVPNSANCAQCHARTSYDVDGNPSIGLPMEAAAYGGMTTGFGNFFRMTPPNAAFDWDKIDGATGTCLSPPCTNDTVWSEFGCKTGMGKRAQRAGQGDQDRFQFGICFGCAAMDYMMGGPGGWFGGGVCQLPSVQASCNAKAGADLQTTWNAIFDMTGQGKKITGKMPDVDAHDAVGVKCATCHNNASGTFGPRTIGSGSGYTYPAVTVNKIDHQTAQGWSTMEKANEVMDGTVTCESCHIEATHVNRIFTDSTGTLHPAPVPGHAGFPAVHFEKIDCRTCHIPAVYAAPGRLLYRDWTAGAYRQTEGSNGNANHFQFRYNFMDGAADPIPVMRQWITVQKDGLLKETKIATALASMLPVWADGSNGNIPLKTRDVTAAAALVAKNNASFGIRINGTNDHPPFQGFQLADTWKIDSAAEIAAMRAELAGTGAGLATHAAVADARINMMPLFFDPSHGVTEKEYALGAAAAGGCVMCHSSSKPCLDPHNPMSPVCESGSDPNYSSKSVGFFDGSINMAKTGMNQLADYDCGGDDTTYYTGGWLNTPTSGMCGMFDPVAMGGDNDGTCDAAEQTACRTTMGQNIFPQFGMPADIATDGGFPVDGVNMMQLMAVREGAMALGCDTRMSFFGMPNGVGTTRTDGVCSTDGNACSTIGGACGTGGTCLKSNGCFPALGDFFSRDEIRQHFQKNLQQVNPGTGNKVFGSIKTGQTGALYDIGSTCYNPMNPYEAPSACTDGGYILTTVDEKLLLGYTPEQLSVLKSLFTASTPSTPVARFSYSVSGMQVNFSAAASTPTTGDDAITSYVWDFGDSASSTGTGVTTSYTYPAPGTYMVSLNVWSPGGNNVKLVPVEVAGGSNTPPVAGGSLSNDGLTVTVTDASTDADASDILRVLVNWGDGTFDNTVQNGVVAHTYAVGGKYTVYLHVTDQRGGVSSIVVTGAPITLSVILGSISGTVTDSSDVGLNNAVVTLMSGTYVIQSVYSEPTGSYLFEDVVGGTYSVTAQLNGYFFPTVSGVVVTEPNETSGVDFSANSTVSVSGRIINAPIQGVLVNLCANTSCTVVMGVDLAYPSINNGGFIFHGIPAGTYVIDPEGLNSTTPDMVTGVTVTTLDVVSAATITYIW